MIAYATGGRIAGCCIEDAFSSDGVVQVEQHVGFEFRNLVDKDAVGVFLFEALEQSFSLDFLIGFVICFGGEKVSVIVERFAGFPCLMEAGNRVRIALIEEIGVAKGEVGGCGGFAGMCVGERRDAGVGGRRAQRGELLGHGPELSGGNEGQLDLVGAGCAAAALGGADVLLFPTGCGGGVVRRR